MSDPSHTAASEVPLPTQPVGLARLWLWSLPSRAISLLSIASFLLAGVGLAASPASRLLFRLPVPAWQPAAAASAVAVVVAWAGRRRPGRLLPRVWSVCLAMGAATAATLAALARYRDEPLLHAWAAAALASALVLAFRLARPAVTGRGAEWIVLLASLTTALLIVFAVPIVKLVARRSWAAETTAAVEELRAIARDASPSPIDTGERAELGWQVAEKRLHSLSAHRPELWMKRRLWAAAAGVGRQSELTAAAKAALKALGQAALAEASPSLGQLAWPPAWFDRERKMWVEDPRFAARSRLVEMHYREVDRLLAALRPPDSLAGVGEGPTLQALYSMQWASWQEHLRQLCASWTDGWAAARVAGGPVEIAPAAERLDALLEPAVLKVVDRSYRPVELWRVMALSGRDAWSIGAQPGCLRHRYAEEATALLRVDCYGYAARHDGDGAELLIEMRLVFRTQGRWRELYDQTPSELYFLFPVPAGAAAPEHQAAVMESFSRAVRVAHPHLQWSADRSGTALRGFRLADERRRLRVHSRAIPYLPGREAIEARVFWE